MIIVLTIMLVGGILNEKLQKSQKRIEELDVVKNSVIFENKVLNDEIQLLKSANGELKWICHILEKK